MTTEQAKEAGRWAREAGRDLFACPTYAMNQQGQPEREAWRGGWHEKDAEFKSRPALRAVKSELKGKRK